MRVKGNMVDKVRAKFRCDVVLPGYGEGTVDVKFDAVIGDSDENKVWSKWTPSGMLTMHISNPNLLDHFEVGKEYFLDIIEC